MINKIFFYNSKMGELYLVFRRRVHDNIFLIIGFYGLLLICILCLLTPWITLHSDKLFLESRYLLPAWNEHGDLSHILGIDGEGRDIFQRLLHSFAATLSMIVLMTLCVTAIGVVISCLCVYVKTTRSAVKIMLKTISAIPSLLIAIVAALFWGNSLFNLMLVVGITASPRFIYNTYNMILLELKKPYIMAARLDGLSNYDILMKSVFPNIKINYLSEIISLFSYNLLSMTTLTFLGFGHVAGYNELGMMMKEMVEIIQINYWAFIAPGLAIMFTIILANFLDFGLSLSFSRQD